MTVVARSLRSGVVPAIFSLIISAIVFAASGVPIQVEETPMSPVFLLIGAAFVAFSSATTAVYFTLKREMEKREA